MKVLVCTLLFTFLFVAGSMAAEPEPATPQGSVTEAAFFCSLAVTPEVPVTKAPVTAPAWQEKAVDYNCEGLASDCLRANCQCSEDCGGSVAQSPCVPYPRQWRDCICA